MRRGAVVQAVGFGYKCQECGRGIVKEHVVPQYQIKIKGYPFAVNDARIGVCDDCGAEHFSAQENEPLGAYVRGRT